MLETLLTDLPISANGKMPLSSEHRDHRKYNMYHHRDLHAHHHGHHALSQHIITLLPRLSSTHRIAVVIINGHGDGAAVVIIIIVLGAEAS